MQEVIRRSRLAAVLAALVLVIPGGAAALPPGPPGGPDGPGGGRLELLVERLGLDAETLAAVDRVLDEARLRQRDFFRQLRAGHEAMRALLEAPEPDEAAVLAQADSLGALETEARKERLRTLMRVRALLPPDARARLVELMREHGPGHHHRQGRGCAKHPAGAPCGQGCAEHPAGAPCGQGCSAPPAVVP